MTDVLKGRRICVLPSAGMHIPSRKNGRESSLCGEPLYNAQARSRIQDRGRAPCGTLPRSSRTASLPTVSNAHFKSISCYDITSGPVLLLSFPAIIRLEKCTAKKIEVIDTDGNLY